ADIVLGGRENVAATLRFDRDQSLQLQGIERFAHRRTAYAQRRRKAVFGQWFAESKFGVQDCASKPLSHSGRKGVRGISRKALHFTPYRLPGQPSELDYPTPASRGLGRKSSSCELRDPSEANKTIASFRGGEC